ncbi:hypothetical protein KP509_31G013200 [Ceratopteris richardii]|uniref:Phospholipase A2 family protein n=1 Tax=Ceratopteris richardii TaxID=49495 RepID=A0A8T2QX08_CERRI|nr:hypothetical protein KP509_31G013200 [Ceratopteris richardii]
MDLKPVGASMKAPSPPNPLSFPSRLGFLPSLVSSSTEEVPSLSEIPSSTTSSPSSSSLTSSADKEAVHELPPFIPYAAQVPWHTGARAFFSQIFPKYGHYCGPNWSSGRSSGSLFWDKPPVDWLDYCCLCHDIGYDSHNQAKLYNADLEFLECLQKIPPPVQKRLHHTTPLHPGSKYSDPIWAGFYRNMYISGLQKFLLPYRRMILKDMGTQVRKEDSI